MQKNDLPSFGCVTVFREMTVTGKHNRRSPFQETATQPIS